MRSTAGYIVAILLIVVAALALRLPLLSLRPMHGDEGREAYTFGQLLEKGQYTYNPHEFHGPALPYLTLPSAWLAGKSSYVALDEADLRIVPVVCGVAVIALILLIGDGLGRWAAIVAALLTAVSPAMSFYSRYFIHEMLLVGFTFAAIAFGWRYVQSGRVGWAIATGLAMGLMHATKETCVIAFGCMGMAIAVTMLLSWQHRPTTPATNRVRLWHLALGATTAVVVSVLLFSSFFTNPHGPLDSILTYRHYFARGSGDGTQAAFHVHPWFYYLSMLLWTHEGSGPVWSEALIMGLGVVGIVAAFLPRRDGMSSTLPRFMAIYAVLMFATYSVIPYKTPWLMLSALQPMILLAGFGAVWLIRSMPGIGLKLPISVLLMTGVVHLAYQVCRTNFRFYADARNPYVYAHTVNDLLKLRDRVNDISRVSPRGKDMFIRIVSDYCWPLPWYLRDFSKVGYWQEMPVSSPGDAHAPDADILIVSSELAPAIDAALHENYQRQFFGFRHNVHLLMYVRQDLWDRFIEARK